MRFAFCDLVRGQVGLGGAQPGIDRGVVHAEQLRHLRHGVAALADQRLDRVAALEVGQDGALKVLGEHQRDRAGVGVRLD